MTDKKRKTLPLPKVLNKALARAAYDAGIHKNTLVERLVKQAVRRKRKPSPDISGEKILFSMSLDADVQAAAEQLARDSVRSMNEQVIFILMEALRPYLQEPTPIIPEPTSSNEAG